MTLSLEYEYVNGQLVSGCFIGNSNVYLFMYLVFPCPSIFIDSRNFVILIRRILAQFPKLQ